MSKRKSSSKLPVTPPLESTEWWGTYIWRLAIANHYDPANLIIQHMRHNISVMDQLEFPIRTESFEFLSALSYQDLDSIYFATPHRLHSFLPISEASQETIVLGGTQYIILLKYPEAYLRTYRKLQFCPLCLSEFGFVSIDWLFKLYTVCVIHHCLLYQTCPYCTRDLDGLDLQSSICKHCKGFLKNAAQHYLPTDDKALMVSTIVFELIRNPVLPSIVAQFLPNNFTPLALLSLMMVASNLAQVELSYTDLSFFRSENDIEMWLNKPKGVYPAFSYGSKAAFYILEDWPFHFYEFLDFVRLRQISIRRLSYSNLDQFFGKWFLSRWLSLDYIAIHQAFLPYFQQELAKNPRKEPTSYERFTQDKSYEMSQISYQNSYSHWCSATQLTIGELAELLHLSYESARNLLESGVLRLRSNQRSDDRADRFSALTLLQKVRALIKGFENQPGVILKFEDVISSPVSASRLVRSILLSELQAYSHKSPRESYFSDLYFKSSDITHL